MKKQKLGLALAVLCAPLVSGLALSGSAFAEGETPTTYSVADFGDDADFFSCIKSTLSVESTETTVPIAAVKALTTLSCSVTNPNIVNVAGINLFTSLTSLTFYDQANLETVNVSGNATLQSLTIKNIDNTAKSALTTVTFAGNSSLANITINDTSLETINLSGAPNARIVSLYNNELTTVTLTQNAALSELVLSNNKIASINLSGNPQLQYLYLYGNELTSIDVTKASKNIQGLYLDENVLAKTDFIAMQIDNGGKYYASTSTNGGVSGMFIPLIISTGLSSGKTKITTPGAAYYGPGQNSNCLSGDAYCIKFDADITNYQNYIQLKYIGTAPDATYIAAGKDYSKQDYRLEINLKEYDPNILVPDTGFFTVQMDGTKAIIYIGSAVLGAGALYLIVYSAKRSLHRNRFRK